MSAPSAQRPDPSSPSCLTMTTWCRKSSLAHHNESKLDRKKVLRRRRRRRRRPRNGLSSLDPLRLALLRRLQRRLRDCRGTGTRGATGIAAVLPRLSSHLFGAHDRFRSLDGAENLLNRDVALKRLERRMDVVIRLRSLLEWSSATKGRRPDFVRRPLRIRESLDPEADQLARDPRAFHSRQIRICGTCDGERKRSRLREGREEEGREGRGGRASQEQGDLGGSDGERGYVDTLRVAESRVSAG